MVRMHNFVVFAGDKVNRTVNKFCRFDWLELAEVHVNSFLGSI